MKFKDFEDEVIRVLGKMSAKMTKAVSRSCSVKKLFLKISQNSQESACLGVSGLRSATLLKTRLWHKCFSVNIAKFLGHLLHRTHQGDRHFGINMYICICIYYNQKNVCSDG